MPRALRRPGARAAELELLARHDDATRSRPRAAASTIDKGAAHRAQPAVECELADERNRALQRLSASIDAFGREDADRDGEIESRARSCAARPVPDSPSRGAAGKRCPAAAVAALTLRGALAHGRLGQPHDVDPWQLRADRAPRPRPPRRPRRRAPHSSPATSGAPGRRATRAEWARSKSGPVRRAGAAQCAAQHAARGTAPRRREWQVATVCLRGTAVTTGQAIAGSGRKPR